MTFEVNAPRMIFDSAEGDTLVIDTLTGVYFSLKGPAGQVWTWIVAGYGEAEMVSTLHSRLTSATF